MGLAFSIMVTSRRLRPEVQNQGSDLLLGHSGYCEQSALRIAIVTCEQACRLCSWCHFGSFDFIPGWELRFGEITEESGWHCWQSYTDYYTKTHAMLGNNTSRLGDSARRQLTRPHNLSCGHAEDFHRRIWSRCAMKNGVWLERSVFHSITDQSGWQ